MIDEDLYRRPPTMLIGTIDKFARLAWVADAGVFFGDARHDPPSLVIQDELHLLAGPLGTVAGIYETAIQSLIAMRGARREDRCINGDDPPGERPVHGPLRAERQRLSAART